MEATSFSWNVGEGWVQVGDRVLLRTEERPVGSAAIVDPQWAMVPTCPAELRHRSGDGIFCDGFTVGDFQGRVSRGRGF